MSSVRRLFAVVTLAAIVSCGCTHASAPVASTAGGHLVSFSAARGTGSTVTVASKVEWTNPRRHLGLSARQLANVGFYVADGRHRVRVVVGQGAARRALQRQFPSPPSAPALRSRGLFLVRTTSASQFGRTTLQSYWVFSVAGPIERTFRSIPSTHDDRSLLFANAARADVGGIGFVY